MGKTAVRIKAQSTVANELQNKVTRQMFEGAKPTLERLAIISNRVIDELKELALHENWLPVPEPVVLQRRLCVLSDKVMSLMEEPEEEALLGKSRLDAITSLLKAIDRLKSVLVDLGDEVLVANDEIEITSAFAAIDQRIDELAEAYAKELVQSQLDAGTNRGST